MYAQGLTGLKSIHYQNLSGQCQQTGPVPFSSRRAIEHARCAAITAPRRHSHIALNTITLPDWTRVDLGLRYATIVFGRDTIFRATVENVADNSYWGLLSGKRADAQHAAALFWPRPRPDSSRARSAGHGSAARSIDGAKALR